MPATNSAHPIPSSREPVYRPHNNGHDVAELVVDSDPDTGAVAAHLVNRTQTAYDKLLRAKHIMRYQWQAAHDLDALWQRARPVPDVQAASMERTGRCETAEIDPEADARLRKYARALGQSRWRTIERLVYDDCLPARGYLIPTRVALQQLAREMGLA